MTGEFGSTILRFLLQSLPNLYVLDSKTIWVEVSMDIREWQVIAIFLLAGCDGGSAENPPIATTTESARQDLASPSNAVPETDKNLQSNEASENRKPVVDLQIVSVDVPVDVTKNAEFPISVTVRNNSNTKLNFAELKARARIESVMYAMDLPMGSGTARNVAPNGSVTATFTGRAPHVSAIAEIRVRAMPGLATDPNLSNNEWTQNITVN
jgi:hypothetical protein